MLKRKHSSITQSQKVCQHENCKTIPGFNYLGETHGILCAKHKLENMVDVKHKTCQHSNCKKQPSYNYEGQLKGIFCAQHKYDNMINVKNKTCQHQNCKTRLNYNYEGETKAILCKEHKLDTMINVKSNTCQHPNCKTHPIYNHEGQTRGIFCKEHKHENMINVMKKICQSPNCKTQPIYNYEGQSKGIFCKEHKHYTMIDVIHKTCQLPNCKIRPTYNYEGQSKAIFCFQHKHDTMINVKDKTCQHPNCKTLPNYNYEGQSRGIFCKEHKHDTMIDVKNKTCQHTKCKTLPNYNYKGQSRGIFCKEHKHDTMIDVKNKKCQHPNCKTIAWYGYPGVSAVRCAVHKQDGMIPFPRRKCQYEKCKQPAIYGTGSIPTHCEEHHDSMNHFNLVQKECVVCHLLEIVDEEQKCSRCSEYLTKRLHLRKQRQVKSWLDTDDELKECSFYDRPLSSDTKCGRERPDFTWDCKTHYLVLEVDEFQHRNYPCECEQKRMITITNSQTIPFIWVRYNPDDYTGCTLKITERVRRDILLRFLKSCMKNPPINESEFLQRPCRYEIDKFIVEKALVLGKYFELSDENYRIFNVIILNKLSEYDGQSDILPLTERLNFFSNIRCMLEKYIKLPSVVKGVVYEIPDYKSRVNNIMSYVLAVVEKEFGIPCEINIKPWGIDDQAVIKCGNVESRTDIKKIIVQAINDKYKDLTGEYQTYSDLKKKLKPFNKDSFFRVRIGDYSIYETFGGRMSICEDVCLIRYEFV